MPTKHDIIVALHRGMHPSVQELILECEAATAIGRQDLLEMLLLLGGARRWCWVDQRGNTASASPAPLVAGRLLRDMLVWPAWVLGEVYRVSRLMRAVSATAYLAPQPTALFLRTDHWFNIRSGGSVGHLSGVIGGLRALGYRTHVLSTDYLANVPSDMDFYCCAPQYGAGRNLPEIPEILYTHQALRFIVERWNRWNPAFIYQRYSLGNYSGVLLKQRFNVPFVCEYNGSFSWMARHWGGKSLRHELLIDKIELLNLHAADIVVVVSQAMRDELIARSIVPEKILVNPNGVDPARYAPSVDGRALRRKLGLGGTTVIGFIGSFGPWHGADVLARAFVRLQQQRPDLHDRVRLLFIGDGQTMPQVQAILAGTEAVGQCLFVGRVAQEEGPAYLAACDILTSPHVPNPDGTPFFGSPTKLFEYMAMGRGIVASDLDQIGEVLAHDKTAWLVPPGDVEALAQGLGLLVDDVERSERLGVAARQEVVQHYTWLAHTRRIIEALRKRCAPEMALLAEVQR